MTLGKLIAVVVVILQAFTPLAYAGGVGSAPDSLDFSLTRDGSETRTLVLLAESAVGTSLAITVIGAARDWVNVTPFGSPSVTPIVEVGSDGRALVEVGVTIPHEVGNGTYLAAIEVSTVDSGATIQTAVTVPITIEVVGDAIVAGSLGRVVVPGSVTVGTDIAVTVTVKNTGTVAAQPSLAIVLSRDQAVRARSTSEFAALGPGESVDLSTRVEAHGAVGDILTMDIAVLFGASEIGRETVTIELAAAGSVDRSVTPLDIRLTDPGESEGITRLVVSFSNDGEEPVTVAFIGSVSRDGAPITSVESIQIQAKPGETGTADIFVEVDRDGDYEVSGRWEGADIASTTVTLGWSVGAAFPLAPIVALFTMLTLLLSAATIRYWRESVRQSDLGPSVTVGSSSG